MQPVEIPGLLSISPGPKQAPERITGLTHLSDPSNTGKGASHWSDSQSPDNLCGLDSMAAKLAEDK